MADDQRVLQLAALEDVLSVSNGRKKILLYSQGLFDYLANCSELYGRPVVCNPMPEAFAGYAQPNDTALYLVDSRESECPGTIVSAAKQWFYDGRYQTSARIALLKEHYWEGHFMGNDKLVHLLLDLERVDGYDEEVD